MLIYAIGGRNISNRSLLWNVWLLATHIIDRLYGVDKRRLTVDGHHFIIWAEDSINLVKLLTALGVLGVHFDTILLMFLYYNLVFNPDLLIVF